LTLIKQSGLKRDKEVLKLIGHPETRH